MATKKGRDAISATKKPRTKKGVKRDRAKGSIKDHTRMRQQKTIVAKKSAKSDRKKAEPAPIKTPKKTAVAKKSAKTVDGEVRPARVKITPTKSAVVKKTAKSIDKKARPARIKTPKKTVVAKKSAKTVDGEVRPARVKITPTKSAVVKKTAKSVDKKARPARIKTPTKSIRSKESYIEASRKGSETKRANAEKEAFEFFEKIAKETATKKTRSKAGQKAWETRKQNFLNHFKNIVQSESHQDIQRILEKAIERAFSGEISVKKERQAVRKRLKTQGVSVRVPKRKVYGPLTEMEDRVRGVQRMQQKAVLGIAFTPEEWAKYSGYLRLDGKVGKHWSSLRTRPNAEKIRAEIWAKTQGLDPEGPDYYDLASELAQEYHVHVKEIYTIARS